MFTVAEIRERLRQHGERIDGRPWPEEAVDLLWVYVALIAHCGLDHPVREAPTGEDEGMHQFLAGLEEVYAAEVAMVREVLAQFRAEALQQGCRPEEAGDKAMGRLKRDYALASELPPLVPGRQYTFREIRARVAHKLRVCGILTDDALRGTCAALVQLVFDASGLSLRLASTHPSRWSADAESALDRLHQLFEEERALLDQAIRHLVQATPNLSDRAFQRWLTRRLNRELLGLNRR
jgi:hypothetical protein